MKKRIGIYSGTFDPIHSGHIAFALQARALCGLDHVVLLPEPRPRGKHDVTDIHHRIELIKRAIANADILSLVTTQSDQFTVDKTLSELTTLFPNAHFTFLFGSDVVRSFPKTWNHLDQLLNRSDLAIGMRIGDKEEDIIRLLEDLMKMYNITFKYTLVRTPDTDVTSSHIRQGLKDTAHLHDDVTSYIHRNSLYKS